MRTLQGLRKGKAEEPSENLKDVQRLGRRDS